MRDLLQKIDPNVWSEFSVIIFGIAFIALVVWVCMPERKAAYERHGTLPLDR